MKKTTSHKKQAGVGKSKLEHPLSHDVRFSTLERPLAAVLQSDLFTELDRQFALFMARLAGNADSALVLAAAMLSRARADGHTCLDLQNAAGKPCPPQAPENVTPVLCPDIESWTKQLRATNVVGAPGEFKPLILDSAGRLYLHRYWEYENTLATEIKRRASSITPVQNGPAPSEMLDRLFTTNAPVDQPNEQRAAALVALHRQLCVISGGPGTGKTWTLVRILALLLELAGDKRIQIAVAAPTGKAAARVQEEIRKAKTRLQCADTLKAQLPERATTIHRLLGANRDATAFRFNRTNPLPFDVVAIDEAGMVDLALMARLVDALAPNAKLILLGDKDQLASVEPGAVLGDICAGAAAYSACDTSRMASAGGDGTGPLTPAHALAGCIVQLRKNYRFSPHSQIYRLSQTVNAGNAADALQILRETGSETEGTVTWVQLPGPDELPTLLKQKIVTGFANYFAAQTPADALNALAAFRVLCALREGPYGVVHINRLAERIFEEAGLINITGPFYARRPIMITRNDYNLQLFNGDTGAILPTKGKNNSSGEAAGSKPERRNMICLAQRNQGTVWTRSVVSGAIDGVATEKSGGFTNDIGVRAFFASAEADARAVLPARLPEHETAYAITVHKSQGSEFDRVLVILPERDVPLLTRELLYTAITRARKSVEILATEPVLVAAIERRTSRSSGLRDALWPGT